MGTLSVDAEQGVHQVIDQRAGDVLFVILFVCTNDQITCLLASRRYKRDTDLLASAHRVSLQVRIVL